MACFSQSLLSVLFLVLFFTVPDFFFFVSVCLSFDLSISQTVPHWLWKEVMSRHHHRFERDYRGVWERRERPAPLHNGVTSNACTTVGPTLANGNNRPGLLPLPVIPSLLPTPVTIAVTTSSNELAAKRAGAPVSAPTVKVGTENRGSITSLPLFPFLSLCTSLSAKLYLSSLFSSSLIWFVIM